MNSEQLREMARAGRIWRRRGGIARGREGDNMRDVGSLLFDGAKDKISDCIRAIS